MNELKRRAEIVRLADEFFADTSKICTGKLVCWTCGNEQDCGEADANQYLRTGWPKCCGFAMTLETAQKPEV